MDNYKRKIYIKYYLKKMLLNSYKKSNLVRINKRYLSCLHLSKLTKIAFITKINNRCIISGRIWSTNKKTNLSRFELRKNLYNSFLPGLKRASW